MRNNYMLSLGLIVGTVLLRLVPHMPNFSPVAGVALFAGFLLPKRFAFVVPIAAMLISDLFLGFHATIGWVYGSYLLIALLGILLRKHMQVLTVMASSFAGSVLFFVLTNFGVWFSTSMYSKDLPGFVRCFTLALPFFRATFIGDILCVVALFGSYALLKRRVNLLSFTKQLRTS